MSNEIPTSRIPLASLAPALWAPEFFVDDSAWIEHAPFAFWLVDVLRPRTFVELGAHSGYSYFCFCQAVQRLNLATTCHAVDAWTGDEHAGFYDEQVFQSVARHNERYSAFSTLLRMTFDDARRQFPDGGVDLLHIDGRHYYDDVRHDFDAWRDKLTDNAIVLFHDTDVRERGFGVWKLFGELKRDYATFELKHGHGLGVLAVKDVPSALRPLFDADQSAVEEWRHAFASLGGAIAQLQVTRRRLREANELAEARAAVTVEKRAVAASLARRTARLRGKRSRLGKLRWLIRAAVQPEKTDLAILRRSLFLDEEWYLATYPDVAAARMRPAEHYLTLGAGDGRDPGPFFSTRDYLASNRDVAKAGLNPLLHFEKRGWREKRALFGAELTEADRRSINDIMVALPALPETVAEKGMRNADYSYRPSRINGSPWRRFGKWFIGLIRRPLRFRRSELADLAAGKSLNSVKRNVWPDNSSADRDTILIVAHEASRTGAPILAWNLVCEFSKRYHVVVLLRRGGAIRKAFDEAGAAVVCLPDRFPMRRRKLKAVVARLVRTYSPLYAIANSVETRYFVPDLERMGVPVVALVHEFSSNFGPIGTLSSLFETASRIVFSAHVVAAAATKDYRNLEARGFEILAQGPSKLPAGANPSWATVPVKTNLRGLWPKGCDGKEFLLVVGMGAIQIRKGVDFFISAAATVHRASPKCAVRFAWVGKCYPGDRPYMEYLKEQVGRSGLSDAFAFIDEVDDLQPIYDQTDIFFLSSRLDPLPNVAIDSALNGIPVICFDQASGMAEILAETADTRELVVPHLDAGAAAQLVCDLAGDPARLARLSKAIRALAEARFGMARYVEAIDRLGRNARTGLDQVKRDHALIAKNNAFNADLYLGISANPLTADKALSRYLNASRLVAPWRQPRAGLLLRRPLEGFHPLIYASDNPQFDEKSGEDPLAHYIRTGRPTGRWAHQVLRPGETRAAGATPRSIAVHGHFHYPDLLPDFVERLKRNATAVDLYLTTTSAAKAEELSKLVAACRLERTKVVAVPNRGRDIGAMLNGLGESLLSSYDVVGHFHGKRSAQFDRQIGERWRNFLWEHLVGGKFAMLDVVQAAFAGDEGLGLVFAEDPHLNGWDENRTIADELARRMGLALPLPNHIDFPVGTMFWARTAALKPLFDLRLAWDDYPEEPLPVDGTILHALERLLPFSADKAGYRYATTYVKGSTR